MRIGIITYHRAINYGAVLQVYALTRFLREQGHDVKVIDYSRTESDVKIFSRHSWKVAVYTFRRNPFSAVLHLYELLKRRIDKGARKQKTQIARKQKMFADFFAKFRNDHFTLTEQYNSLDDLLNHPPDMDAYIAGSDQIWRPESTIFSPAYFLDFGKRETLRIAYAPSFGQASLEKSWYPELERNLKRFDAVSVREKSGVRIVNEAGGKAVHVVDPTLLIDDYSSVTRINDSDEFLFAYRLHQNEQLSKMFDGIIEKLAGRHNLKIKIVAPMNEFSSCGEDVVVGVEDFLGLIASCRIMVTNSFHGTIFAVLHKKKFICFPRVEEARGQNERMLDLLEDLGLRDRYFDIHQQLDPLELIDSEIDWDSVNRKLAVMREESAKFLIDALNVKKFHSGTDSIVKQGQ